MELDRSVIFNSTKEALDFYLDCGGVTEGNFTDIAKQLEIPRNMKIDESGRNVLAKMIEKISEYPGIKIRKEHEIDEPAETKFGAWKFLVYCIMRDENFAMEAYECALEFLLHASICVEDVYNLKFVDDSSLDGTPSVILDDMALNTLLGAGYHGNKEAIEKLKTLCKKNLSPIFKQVKRYKALKYTDIIDLAKTDGVVNCFDIASVLVIAEIQGIEIKKECKVLYLYLNACVNQEMQNKQVTTRFEIDDEMDVEALICKMICEDELSDKVAMYDDLCKEWLKSIGFSEHYLPECEIEKVYYDALLLWVGYIKRELSVDELAALIILIKYLGLLRHVGLESETVMKFLAFEIDRSSTGSNESPTYDLPVIIETQDDLETKNAAISALEKEVAEYKRRLRDKENDNCCMRKKMEDLKEENKELIKRNTDYEDDRVELVALRNFAYSLKACEMEPKAADEKVIDRLKMKKVTIIGGHPNWVSKLRNRFPNWVFVSPEASGTVNATIVRNADMVYFCTNVLSHGNYYKFIQLLRAEKRPFGYLEETNIDNVINKIGMDI